jgi:hypothetical protein
MKRLVSRTASVAGLDAAIVNDAFALFESAYDGAERARFERDLAEKQTIILLRDRDTGALKGFSTVTVHAMPDGRGRVVFSGDTVIDREYWGQKQLQIAFTRVLLRLKLRAPRAPLFWFLISKGYRTYMLLANAFPRAVPRCDRAEDPALRAALDELAMTRFGPAYRVDTGVVHFPHERVREGLAPITHRLLENPHVRFFTARNPGHAAGDELACLAEVRLVDIARIVARLSAARMRRVLDLTARAGRRTARWSAEVRRAEGS